MALGKAFIEVHADTKPFARELASELNKILKAAEGDVRKSANKVGQTVADGVSKGVDKEGKKVGQSIQKAISKGFGTDLFGKFTTGIIDSLDDGLSGLPAEVKVALGAALVAILPFIGAAISTLVSATVVAAFGGLGFLIAAQFQEVQTGWESLVSSLRDFLARTGSVLVDPVLRAFEMIRTRVFALEGWFREVFAASAQFIEPLTNAVFNLIEGLLPGLLNTLRNSTGILTQLQEGFGNLGRAIGTALDLLTSSDYADDAFRDLLFVLGSLILSAAAFIRVLTEIYGRLRDISLILSGPQGWARLFAQDAADSYANKVENAADANGLFGDSLERLLAPTEAEEQAVKALNQQISRLQQLVLAQVNNEIAWEQAIDDLTESVQRNGTSLKLTEQAGRNNANALIQLAQAALKTRDDQIAMTGQTDLAQAAFEKQRAKIYQLAEQMRLSKTDTDKLVGALLNIPPPRESGISQGTINRILTAISLAKSLASAFGAVGGIGAQIGAAPHADGGVFNRPHVGLVAEAGPEAIIPLNNPARAQQIMNEAGLSSMSSPTVNVYIGNQQIDAYIDTRVSQRMSTTARDLAYGSRGI